jgi:membrane peptidoglycan carboxypeptidase
VVNNPSSHDEMLLQALGEANVLTTPLALLDAYRRLLAPQRANEGPTASRVLRQGMRDCVRAGTGIEARVPGLDIGGKTGTATSADRRSLNGWMLSFWPVAQPKFVMVVFVENGRGGVEAAPIAGAAWRALRPRLPG